VAAPYVSGNALMTALTMARMSSIANGHVSCHFSCHSVLVELAFVLPLGGGVVGAVDSF